MPYSTYCVQSPGGETYQSQAGEFGGGGSPLILMTYWTYVDMATPNSVGPVKPSALDVRSDAVDNWTPTSIAKVGLIQIPKTVLNPGDMLTLVSQSPGFGLSSGGTGFFSWNGTPPTGSGEAWKSSVTLDWRFETILNSGYNAPTMTYNTLGALSLGGTLFSGAATSSDDDTVNISGGSVFQWVPEIQDEWGAFAGIWTGPSPVTVYGLKISVQVAALSFTIDNSSQLPPGQQQAQATIYTYSSTRPGGLYPSTFLYLSSGVLCASSPSSISGPRST